MKAFSNYGQSEFDGDNIGRRKDGLRGMADVTACRGGFGGLENNKTDQTENVKNEQVTVQGGSGSSTTVGVGGQDNTANLTVNNYNADASIITSVSNGLTQLAAIGESENAQNEETDNLTLQSVLQDFDALVANTVPQSAGAQAELLNGTSPLAGEATPANSFWSWISSDQIADVAVLLGTLLTVGVYLKTKGKST